MHNISDLNIQKMFPREVYERGLSYYKNNQVSDLLFDLNHHIWTANVYGSEMYFVEVDVKNLAKGSIIAYCDCPAFHTYDSCKHIVAVLLSISHQQNKKVKNDHEQKSNELLDMLAEENQNHLLREKNKIPLHVEYYCELQSDGNFYVHLKTGEHRCFVVRDLYRFLGNALENRMHYFTKTFTYDPDIYTFLKQDREIFQFLYAMYTNEKVYMDQNLREDLSHQRSQKRSLFIPPILMKTLLMKLSKRDLMLEIEGQTSTDIEIVEKELPLYFALERNEQGQLQLLIQHLTESIYYKKYEMLFFENTIYFPTKEQVSILNHFDQYIWEDQSLAIGKERIDMLLSKVVPSLEKIGHVDISEDVSKQIVQKPLTAKLALELDHGRIIGVLTYHYGSYEIDPFLEKEKEERLIIRDIAKEQEVMLMIEEAQFKYNGKELYIDPTENELYEFLYTTLPILEQYVELLLSADLRKLIITEEPTLHTNVTVESSTNLLEVNFNIDGIDENEINELLKAVVEKKRFYRLRSGSFIPLDGEEFATLGNFLDELNIKQKDLEEGTLQIPAYRGSQIDDLLTVPKDYDASFQRLLERLKSPEKQEFKISENLQTTLRSYQKIGYQWFKTLSLYHLGGILADDMGLGKTIQAIAYLLSEPKELPNLIVVPSSVVYNWKNECQRFAPDLSVEVMIGTPEERKEKIAKAKDIDLWITSYATLRQDIKEYKEISFQNLILDEAQYIKNYETKTSRAVRQIKAQKRFALSGTPIENSIEELWSIFQVILPGFLPNRKEFLKFSHEKISRITKPFILRRMKEDVLQELPEKIESITISELTEEQKKLYVGYLQRLQQETTEALVGGTFQQQRMKILAGLTRLRQICCHPSLFIENYEGQSGKFTQLMELIQTSLENNKRLLIFSQFTTMHELIRKQLEKEAIDYFYLHGQTPSEERIQMSERFNQGEKNIFLISLRAGGTGLNLTGADTVILYDLWWNPAVEDQAMGRAHRYGQKNVVQVIRLITEGTIEEKIYELQQKKRSLLDRIIQPGETMLTHLTEKDIRELLNV